MTPYLTKRHAIANEPNPTLRRIGLTCEMVRELANTPPKRRIRATYYKRIPDSQLAFFEALLESTRNGKSGSVALINKLAKAHGVGPASVTHRLYRVFGTISPSAADLAEFVAEARGRVEE